MGETVWYDCLALLWVEKNDSVSSRSSLSSYLGLSVMPGHFKQLPDEQGCLEQHHPRASFGCILQEEGGG